MAHALAAHLGGNDFHAALFAHDAAVLHALVLAAVALVVFHRAEYLGAEQAVAFRLEGAVIDGLRLFHFTVRPFADVLRRGNGDLNSLQIPDIRHTSRCRSIPHGKQIVQTHSGTLPLQRVSHFSRCEGCIPRAPGKGIMSLPPVRPRRFALPGLIVLRPFTHDAKDVNR